MTREMKMKNNEEMYNQMQKMQMQLDNLKSGVDMLAKCLQTMFPEAYKEFLKQNKENVNETEHKE